MWQLTDNMALQASCCGLPPASTRKGRRTILNTHDNAFRTLHSAWLHAPAFIVCRVILQLLLKRRTTFQSTFVSSSVVYICALLEFKISFTHPSNILHFHSVFCGIQHFVSKSWHNFGCHLLSSIIDELARYHFWIVKMLL